MSLPDTSAKEVEIFWLSLNLAKETVSGMYGIIMMKNVSYLLEISSSLVVISWGLPGSHVLCCVK